MPADAPELLRPEETARHTRPVVDPRTGNVLGWLALLGADEVASVARTAAAAAAGWAATPLAQRCQLVERLADAVDQEAAAPLFSGEHGKTVDEARAELARAAETFRWAARAGGRLSGDVHLDPRDGLERLVQLEPAGPVLAIVPWNFPAVITARKLAPALVAGCPVVVKGPEETPRCVHAFAAAAERAGIPAGVVQVVFAEPPVAQALVRRAEFSQISFTGSARVGRLVAAGAALTPTPCVLELGGHAPVIVAADADLGSAVPQLAAAKFGSAGQSCGAPSRFLVHRSRYDEFVERFVAAAPALDDAAGRPGQPVMGPLNNAGRRAEVHRLVLDAVARGGRLRLGGLLPTTPGFYYPATVLADVPLSARILHEEPFGPVAPILGYDDEAAAVAVANSTDYALSAYVYGDTAAARRIAGQLQAGNVMVNATAAAAPDAPLGGRRASGYGYEGGAEGFLSFCRLKVVQSPEVGR
jgi:succinate-semialdehyde dehydrogenase / glutarate-semialdehyde dehydrogenase